MSMYLQNVLWCFVAGGAMTVVIYSIPSLRTLLID